MSHGETSKPGELNGRRQVNPDIFAAHAQCIEREIAWFRAVLDLRFRSYVKDPDTDPLSVHPPPDLPDIAAPYAEMIRRFNMSSAERLILILAFIPYIRPDVLDPYLIQNEPLQRRFSEFGGITGSAHGGFLPTCETGIFLLAGGDIRARLTHQAVFRPEHFFSRSNILRLNHEHRNEPPNSASLQLTPEALEELTTGRSWSPPFSSEFPAQRIATESKWHDLVVENATRRELEDIVNWVRYQRELLDDWLLRSRIKPGFRSLFYGSPGTGKSMSAALLGKATGLDVYRVDLSKVVSKYIGETEKNLARLFDQAENRRWILFFDEADSLFGKRTDTRNANDRSANQQVSYLLQRIEDFPGVVILATNLKSHIDEAFARRFQSVIHFAMPGVEQRLRLWDDNFRNKPYRLGEDVDLEALANDYELSGGSIVNVLRFACLKAIARTPPEIQSSDLLFAIRNERHKEGKFLEKT